MKGDAAFLARANRRRVARILAQIDRSRFLRTCGARAAARVTIEMIEAVVRS